MKFKSLRLTGFKSFVDPSELTIQDGLTGIVGPNGCGKSNLVEALRWVMGETSYKSMRASAMEDVIFGGSSSRPQRNTAEVVLQLEELDGTAPAGFGDYDQLEISRRITRDTGSQYRINGRDMRARDVQLLFADASTGAHSTSMVAQGKVAELIAAKPQARRAILEEAAGISGLYTRRHEAELRLKATETNLERVSDTLNVLESQLEALKRQARQARKYKAISEDIRKLEALLAHLRVLEAREAVSQGHRAVDEANKASQAATQKAAEATNALNALASKTADLRDEEARSGAKLQHLNITKARLEDEEKALITRAQQLENQLKQTMADLERENRMTAENIAMKAELSREQAQLEQELNTNEAQVREAAAKFSALDHALKNEEQSLQTLRREVASAEALKASALREVNLASARLEKLLQEKRNLEADATRLQDSLKGLADPKIEADRFAQAKQALTTIGLELQSARELEESARAAMRDKRNAEEMARKALDRLDTEIRTLERLLTPKTQQRFTPVLDAVRAQSGYEKALTAALGDDLDASLERGASSFWQQLARSQPYASLPAGAQALSQFVQAPEALNARLSQVGVVAKSEGATLQPQLEQGQRLVSLEGDLWRWDGFASSNEAPSNAAQRLEERNRLEGLKSEQTNARASADAAKAGLNNAIEALRKHEGARTSLEQREREARKAIDQSREILSRQQADYSRFEARIENQRQNEARVNTAIHEAQTELQAAQSQQATLPDTSNLVAQATELDAKLSVQRANSAEAHASARSLEQTQTMRQNRLKQIERDLSQWQARASNALGQEKALTQRQDMLRKELSEIEKLPAQIKLKQDFLLTELEKAQAERRVATDAYAAHEVALSEATRFEKQAEQTLASAAQNAAVLAERLEGAKAKLRDLYASIEDTLDMSAAEVSTIIAPELEQMGEVPPLDQLQNELERLKIERVRLGAVNLRADVEMEETQGQLDALTKEKTELEQAISSLRHAISKLNQEGRERLLASFDQVNGHFKQLFSTLFSGGEAELHLTESDDPLEAGLEIIARPPGKKPQILTLLSGGEQALTATALIFAVFLTNPAPICVLDEVDAPLDDSNVERLCAMLSHVQGLTGTRFLVITHHPLTMSRMDRLFGVTMAERGVSKLVSVNLKEAEVLAETA